MFRYLISLFLASFAAAIAAPNDNFADRIVVSGALPQIFIGNTTDATIELDEPDPLGIGGASIWYEWTVPGDGVFAISASVTDTVLYAFLGNSLNALTLVAANGGYQGGGSRVLIAAKSGQTFQVAVHGREGAAVSTVIEFSAVAANSNDDFEDAIAIAAPLPATLQSSNFGASLETGEPDPLEVGGASVWYSWTAPSSGRFALLEAGNGLSAVMYVFTGSQLPFLTEVAAGIAPPVQFDAVAGTTYWIAVHGFEGAQGSFELGLSERPPAPGNDDFADRIPVVGELPLTIQGTNLGASLEAGEPDPLSRGGASVWYEWTAPSSGSYSINSAGSELSAVLYLYTGNELVSLSLVAAADESISFLASGGTSYQLAVHGFYGGENSFQLALSRNPGPANDHFEDRQEITGTLPLSVSGSNVNATLEVGEPDPLGEGGASVWFTWTAPSDGVFSFSTLDSTYFPLIYVFTGEILGSLSEVAVDYREVRFAATEGSVYQVAVHGFGGSQGALQLDLRQTSPPGNDRFADRMPVGVSLPLTVGASNVDAMLESGEPDPWLLGGASVWFTWTAPTTGTFRISSAGSAIGTVLYVFSGDQLGSLLLVNTDGGGEGTTDTAEFSAALGETYAIAVHGQGGGEGVLEIQWSQTAGPPPIEYGTWVFQSGLSFFQASPTLAPQGDELINTIKYAFNMDPTIAVQGAARHLVPGSGDSGLPYISVSGGFLQIEFIRRINALDLSYEPQFCSDLIGGGPDGWQVADGPPISVAPLPDGWERVIYRDPVSVSASGRRFGRVVISYAPVF